MMNIHTLLASVFLGTATFTSAIVPTVAEAQTVQVEQSECTKVVIDQNCDPAHDGNYTGNREVETFEITVCALPEHWAAIQRLNPNDSWWGEALADTGRPDLRWLKIRAIKSQCRTRDVTYGARVGTMYECPPTVVGWHWTPVITGPGTYFMSIPEPGTKATPAG